MGSNSDKRIRRKVRRSYLISTISIALVLFILGAVSYVTLSAVNAAEALRERVVISVELADSLTKSDKRELLNMLRERSEIANIDYLTKDEKINDDEFRRQFEQDIFEVLDENPLRDSFELTLAKECVDVDVVDGLVFEFEHLAGVEYISVPPVEVVESMHKTISDVSIALLIFMAVLLFISLLLLSNTIRLVVYSKRYLINTMKLVGATKWYIMRPFLGTALRQGLVAGLLAAAMLVGVVYGAESYTINGVEMLGHSTVGIIIATVVALGVVITVLFSAFAVNKFVNMRSNKIHLY